METKCWFVNRAGIHDAAPGWLGGAANEKRSEVSRSRDFIRYVIEEEKTAKKATASLEEAVEIAKGNPCLNYGVTVEVRPIAPER